MDMNGFPYLVNMNRTGTDDLCARILPAHTSVNWRSGLLDASRARPSFCDRPVVWHPGSCQRVNVILAPMEMVRLTIAV
ncbi:uncharacterized protein N7479_004792 [Penicillium vulpinum]|uniref:uncharacterized protein n=1 Tax=Penicillium vulpinum TaxID=29845 RepID=UPI0025488725|nr:uncharacterized protein N7479_004792 [Penicillium vulpinum]KAJ5964916.1 hypothetical protein N7479_004792 [Penicillium vulpinum]